MGRPREMRLRYNLVSTAAVKSQGESMEPRSVPQRLIDANIANAYTLPASYYFDPSCESPEKEKIFARTWQIIGHVDKLPNPGSFFTAELAGEPLLITRNAGGEIKGFYNVCKHRAGPPAEGCGERKVFRCGYHGWTYSLDGDLLNAPECDGVANFRREDFGLTPVRVPEQAAHFGFDKMKLFERRVYEMQCNWKTYIDNYLEGYHLPSVHPGLNRELDYNAYTVEPHARHVRQFSPIRGAQPGDATPRRYQEAHENLTIDYFWVFPNWMLNCYPDNVSLNIVAPIDAEHSLAIFEWYLPEKDLGSAAAKASVEFSDQIQIEDVGICETVQKNLRSRSYQRGRYSIKQETGVHAFHRTYVEEMNS